MVFKLGITDFQRIVGVLPAFELEIEKSALLIIDMHYLQVHRDFGYGKRAQELGMADVIDYYYGRLENEVVPRLQNIIPRFRNAGSQVIYCRVVSPKGDGSDFCLRYRGWGLAVPESSREADILDDIAPQPGDIVLNKTTQNVFLSTNLDQILRNLRREYLVVAGVVTNNCVEAAVRTAVDLSYKAFVLEDCCAAFSEEAHVSALRTMHMNFGVVKSSADLQIPVRSKGAA
ncbi:MAG TPA: isochorismatase family cysteine hydrolase [Candidatus Dormibacteraeota bacterium]|nr:isochorismatase family cysteine hydrolase [Candidatus Dormibacteraeota bacterium]